ncbi:HBS1-like protein isoform X1 [Aplysia californica]|uniref:HBS1-like protein isoform X1 n=1 Tax=Aplysia californica TaxID=6500 RepID=A0ABM0JZ19_APLCA|nr:HBS1-like protein isoform X1 [Aplysia californica]
MSRHRIVRSMNYEDEYYDEDEEYSRSVEDNYCISPSTAAQFTWNREKNLDFSAYMGEESVIDEEEEEEDDGNSTRGSLSDSASSTRPLLSDEDQARLNSCLEEIRNILGESVPESVMSTVIIQNQFNLETSLNQLLTPQDAPKPQREPRQRRLRSQASPAVAAAETDCPSNGVAAPAAPVASATVPGRVPPVGKSAVVTPSKSTAKATVGFETPKETPPSSPATSKKPGLKLKMQSTPLVPSSPGSEMDSTKTKTVSSRVSSKSPEPPDAARSDLGKGAGVQEAEVKGAGVDSSLRNAVEFMGLEGDKDVIQASVESMKPSQLTPKPKSKNSKLDVMAEYAKRHGEKELLNLVVIGHVDAGKSTLMGHLLYQLGSVNKKTMHKYEQESKKLGKSSFAFAWVLDETEEERSRGVTMDVAQTRFETDKKVITLLDAPGHRDFIPNMITGAAQADVGILVINATRGEFETGFDAGGQTREHALLARSLGVGQIIVAVNKMDTVEWNEERYRLITKKIGQFLSKQAGFKDTDVSFIPCSGLSGENLVKPATEPKLTAWYQPAVPLMEQIDKLRPPQRPIDKPFRLNVSDVFKGIGTGFNVSGRVGSGYVQPGDKVLILPAGITATIKNVFIDDSPSSVAFAGDHVNLTMSGVDMANVNIGSALCDPSAPSKSATRIRAKIVLFSMEVPITKGFPVVFHYQSINEPAVIKRLISQLNRSTGEVIKKKPRCLVKNSSAVVEIELERSMCLELYSEYKDLGRFMLRTGGHTIAAGVVEEIVQVKASLNGAGPS